MIKLSDEKTFLQASEHHLIHTVSNIPTLLMFEELFAAPTLVLTSYRKLLQEMNVQPAFLSLNSLGLQVYDRKYTRKN